MASFHSPDLAAIDAIQDQAIRFYAIVGVLMSLTGALERAEFQTFHKGTRLEESLAASIFYAVQNDRARSKMAMLAMDHRASKDPALLAVWEPLAARVKDRSIKAARNLVSHNPAVREVRSQSMGLLLLMMSHTAHQVVRQDPIQIQFGDQKADEAEYGRIRDAADRLSGVLKDLGPYLDALTA